MNVGAGTPVHEPCSAVSVEPTCAVPVIVGGARLLGGPVTSFVAELADADPLPFVPVTATTSL